ncbi:hypothetical protein AOLI_G00154330 [Acnodon oligacanthus]
MKFNVELAMFLLDCSSSSTLPQTLVGSESHPVASIFLYSTFTSLRDANEELLNRDCLCLFLDVILKGAKITQWVEGLRWLILSCAALIITDVLKEKVEFGLKEPLQRSSTAAVGGNGC